MPACCRTTLMLTVWDGTTLPATPAVSSSARTRNSWLTWSRPTTKRMSQTPSQKVMSSYATDRGDSLWNLEFEVFLHKSSTLAAPEAILDGAHWALGLPKFFGEVLIQNPHNFLDQMWSHTYVRIHIFLKPRNILVQLENVIRRVKIPNFVSLGANFPGRRPNPKLVWDQILIKIGF